MYFAVRGVSVYYDKVRAVSDISLVMDAGDVIAIIGANGAGKTTTLRAVTGLAPIASGEIWFEGHRIDRLPPDRIVGLGISMVPEGRHVFPFMSVGDNLLMGAFARRDRRAIEQDVERVFVRFPRLKERRRQQAGTLSGGEQQMLAIGRALMAEPALMLLDEPSLGLAPMLVEEIFAIIRGIHAGGTTVLLVEQNANKALSIADYGYVLETGTIALAGDSQQLLKDDRVRRAYLGQR